MYVSGDSYKPAMLDIGSNMFKQTHFTHTSIDAAQRIYCATRNSRSPILRVVVRTKTAPSAYTPEQLRKISEMITWCLNEGGYMRVHPKHGYLDNKYMCLILTAIYPDHGFTDKDVVLCGTYILASLDASSGGQCTAVAHHLNTVAGHDLTAVELRAKAFEWYQLLLNDIESKINKLEQEAA